MTDSLRLKDLRADIERVTLEIVSLAGKRTALAREVSKEKLRTGTPLVNREIEQHLRNVVVEQCKEDKSDSTFALRLLNQLIMKSVRTQESQTNPSETASAYNSFMKANALERAGKEIIHLEVGEPDFGPPEAVATSMTKAVAQGFTGYSSSEGIHELREKISNQMTQKYGVEIDTEQVIITVGGRFAIYLGVASTISVGDEVIILDPTYPAYSNIVRHFGGKPIHVSTTLENSWIPDMGLVEDNISTTTRMIILNSPANPTGKILDESSLTKIIEIAVENDIRIVSDEVYSEFVFSPHSSVLQFPHCDQVYVNSFSKTYGMTGFRLGYAISNLDTIQKMSSLQNLSLTCVPEFIQHAGVSALDCVSDVNNYTTMINQKRETFCNLLDKLPVSFHRPEGGFYIFPRIETGNMDGLEFADQLLDETGVSVVPGVAFGSDCSHFFRIAVCQPENHLIEAAKRIKEVLG